MNNPPRRVAFPTKAAIDQVLFGDNRKLLNILPDTPEDVVDAYAFEKLHALAMANTGCGIPAISANHALEKLRCLSYAELRDAIRKQRDFNEFVRQYGAHFTPNA